MTFWTEHLDHDDQVLMVTELRACADTLELSGDPEPLETCLREWRTTGESLSDPVRRAVLTGEACDNYEEVPRP